LKVDLAGSLEAEAAFDVSIRSHCVDSVGCHSGTASVPNCGNLR
jgi:hypothetical protein